MNGSKKIRLKNWANRRNHVVKAGFYTATFFAWAEKARELFFDACVSWRKCHWFGDSPCSRAALELGGRVELILLSSALFCSLADLASDSQSSSSIWQIWYWNVRILLRAKCSCVEIYFELGRKRLMSFFRSSEKCDCMETGLKCRFYGKSFQGSESKRK